MPLVVDPAFRGVKDKQDGIYIWRIEKMQVVPLHKKYYGQFHSGDSYIVLYTNKRKGECNIHFWLGKETTRDEAGTAAIKSVELDDLIGGYPVQYREVESHETRKFLSYFKSGIRYQEGGVATGFKEVKKEEIKRLIQVKGCRNPRLLTVNCSSDSMNEGDCFILDLGEELYLWQGKQASRREKQKAAEAMRDIRDSERAGRGQLHYIVSGEESPDSLSFFTVVGSADAVKSAAEGGSDEVDGDRPVSLYKVTDSSGKVVISKVAGAPLSYNMLDTKDCFIVDAWSSVFVWVGKQATRDERASSMVKAEGFLAAKGRPDWTPITRVIEGAETVIFKSLFSVWPYSLPKSALPGQPTSRGSKEVKTFDVSTMLQSQREEQHMPDNFRGKIQVWRVEDFKLIDWPISRYGIFFQGDSYVVLYSYKKHNKDNYIIYFWLGLDCGVDEQGAAPLLTIELDNRLGGSPVQQRVVQGHEPEHFLRIFKGKMLVKHGGRAKGAETLSEAEEQGGTVHLYRVRGTNEFNTRCFEVELKAASLNSNDVFILVRPGGSFVWCGKGASGDERQFAKEATKMIADNTTTYELVIEGSEPDLFWKALGGKTEYMSTKELREKIPLRPPRLFHCSNDKGYFYAEEVFDFTQEDLEEDDVMVLDTNSDTFLWLGNDCNQNERKEGLLLIQKFVEMDKNSGRDPKAVNQIVVKQGSEPMSFTSWFPSWNDAKWREGKTYEQQKRENADDGVRTVTEALADYKIKFYPYDQLTAVSLPEGVDASQKEMYLEDNEFQSIFGMTKGEFNSLATWKKQQEKRKYNLF